MGTMSLLMDRVRRSGARGRPSNRASAPVASGLVAAGQAAGASLVLVLAPVVGAWVLASSQATWLQAGRVGIVVWGLAHHGGVTVQGGHIGLVPLGLTGVALVACWLAGRGLARRLDPRADRIREGFTRARPSAPPSSAVVAFVTGYALLATVASQLAGTPDARPVSAQVLLGAVAVATVGGGAGVAAYVAGGLLPGIGLLLHEARLPAALLRGLRAGTFAVAVHLAGAALLLAVALVASADSIGEIHTALDPGAAGSVVLALGQLAVVPNLVIWAGAVIAGPGFAVGVDSSVTAWQSTLGPMPAIPVLGVLPAPGPLPPLLRLAVALPVAAGVVAGSALAMRRRASPVSLAADAVACALAAGGVFLVLAWLSGGPIGPGRLAVSGPAPWVVGLAVAVEVGLGAGLAVASAVLLPDARRLLTGVVRR
jgi:hypothetical protein